MKGLSIVKHFNREISCEYIMPTFGVTSCSDFTPKESVWQGLVSLIMSLAPICQGGFHPLAPLSPYFLVANLHP